MIVNEQQSASAAFSQPCFFCRDDILCSLLFEYLLHTLRGNKNPLGLHGSECFLPFYFITGAEYRTLPQWRGCHRPLGSLHIRMEALLKVFNVVLSLFMTLFFISSESPDFFFYITKSIWCRTRFRIVENQAAGRKHINEHRKHKMQHQFMLIRYQARLEKLQKMNKSSAEFSNNWREY